MNLDAWLFPVPDEIQNRGILNTEVLCLSAEMWQFGKVCFNKPIGIPLIFCYYSSKSPFDGKL